MKRLLPLMNRQTGATLITALVMLVVLTLLVLSAINSSTINLRIAGNMQVQEEAIAAAQMATEQVISVDFASAVAPTASSVTVTIGGASYQVTVSAPYCTNSIAVANADIPPHADSCRSKLSSDPSGTFYEKNGQRIQYVAGQSWCDAQQWDIESDVTDPTTGAQATVHQGIDIDVIVGTACP